MGRMVFGFAWPLFVLLVRLYRFFPRFLKLYAYDISSLFSGYIAVLFRYFYFCAESNCAVKNLYIGKSVILKNISNVSVGENVSIHDMCYIDGVGGILIGDNVSIAHGSSLISFNHAWNDYSVPIKYNEIILKPIKICDDVWIGCGVRIMPGVTIGSRSVVAAGAVVVNDVPANCIVAGIPARIIKEI